MKAKVLIQDYHITNKFKYYIMFTIQVFENATGKPVISRKISVIFNGWMRGCAKDQYTDKNGEAHFPEDNGDGTIYIQGSKVFEGRIEGRKIIYI